MGRIHRGLRDPGILLHQLGAEAEVLVLIEQSRALPPVLYPSRPQFLEVPIDEVRRRAVLDEQPAEVLPVYHRLAAAFLEMEDLLLVDQHLGTGGGLNPMGEPAMVDVGVGQEDPTNILQPVT